MSNRFGDQYGEDINPLGLTQEEEERLLIENADRIIDEMPDIDVAEIGNLEIGEIQGFMTDEQFAEFIRTVRREELREVIIQREMM